MILQRLNRSKATVKMTKNRKTIALIPARAGSKGVKNKNIREINGIPLVEYTINSAKRSTKIDDIWITTDSQQVAEIARAKEISLIERPSELATEYATASQVIRHAISHIMKLRKITERDLLIYLQPTSPLRTERHIDEMLNEIKARDAIGAISVLEAEKHPYKSFTIAPNGNLQSLFNEKTTNENRQNLPKCYHPNGAMYAFLVKEFLENDAIPSNKCIPYIMNKEESIDIDSEDDLQQVKDKVEKRNERI